MNDDPRLGYRSGKPGGIRQPGLFGRVLALSIGSLLLGTAVVFAVMFSLVVLPVVLLVGAVGIGYLWFKTRPLRREIDAQMRQMRATVARQGSGAPGAGGAAPGSPGTAGGPGGSGRPGQDGRGRGPSRQGDVIDGDFIREAPEAARPDDIPR